MELLSPSHVLPTIVEETEEEAKVFSPIYVPRPEEGCTQNFKVVIRVRPPVEREKGKNFSRGVSVHNQNQMITVGDAVSLMEKENEEDFESGSYPNYTFAFDHIYDEMSSQQSVYNDIGKPALLSTLQGYNASIIAYGQTGAGKTYTMEGFSLQHDENRGILPRCVEAIFDHISCQVNSRRKFLVRASYLQIYNEVISDLLKPDRQNLTIREDKKKGIYVEGLSEWVVRTPSEIYELMHTGASMRATAATKSNIQSSRSHAIFIIIAEQSESYYIGANGNEDHTIDEATLAQLKASGDPAVHQRVKIGKLNLVDLAGSERVRVTGATGKRLEESKKINQSLSALGNVVSALTDPKGRPHIPFRDSKLTRILEDSLGGNCKTTMMAMTSPALESYHETMSTLKFANRAKHIKNSAEVNVDLDQKALLGKYESELKQLRTELGQKSRNVVDKRRLLEVEEKRRQAEEDKMATINALEEQSRGLMHEKMEKKALEERIRELQSQLLTGGNPEDKLLAAGKRRGVLDEYDGKQGYEEKLMEIEKERQLIDADKAQVDRYKLLLMKQRDIMVALTARLNERDDVIGSLQEELDAYDLHQQLMEDTLDSKTAMVIALQKLVVGHQRPGDEPVNQQQRPVAIPVPSQQQPSGASHILDHDKSALSLKEVQVEARAVEQQVKDVEAERVSLEYLLYEKLEKMVEVEIEERINMYSRISNTKTKKAATESSGMKRDMKDLGDIKELMQEQQQEERRLTQQIKDKQRQLDALYDEHKTLKANAGGQTINGQQLDQALYEAEKVRAQTKLHYESQLSAFLRDKRSAESQCRVERQRQVVATMALKQQCETNEKERVALKTILDLKIKALIENINKAVVDKPHSGPVMREVHALRSLVVASAAALGFDQPSAICR